MVSIGNRKFYTIGIPAFNEQNTLRLALDSIYNQTRQSNGHYHLVVVVNGCTDDTLRIALDFGNSNWRISNFAEKNAQRSWHYYTDELSYSIVEVPIAQKSLALNIIHSAVQSDAVLLFDADTCVGPGTIAGMCAAFEQNSHHGAVAVRYYGFVPPLNWARNLFLEIVRIVVERCINHFDKFCPRLDGKAYGYRRNLIERHPAILAADTWLEGTAWQNTAGCIYLSGVYVQYRFPNNFGELLNQYTRYAQAAKDLSNKYPLLLNKLTRGRACSQLSRESPHILARAIGWLFFKCVDLYSHYQFLNEGWNSRENESWQPIRSTKQF